MEPRSRDCLAEGLKGGALDRTASRTTPHRGRVSSAAARTVFFALILSLVSTAVSPAARVDGSAAVITTDKENYFPEETVVITGSGFAVNATVTITVTRPDGNTTAWVVSSSEAGSFTTTYQLDGIEGTYTVEATDGTNSATTTFTDAAQIQFRECENDANNDNSVDVPTMCTWITSTLNDTNTVITEGNNAPPYPPIIPGHVAYRMIFEGLVAGTYEVTLNYSFTRVGKVAFDFLTTNFGVTDANMCDNLPGGFLTSTCATLIAAGADTMAFPTDSEAVDSSLGGGTVADRQTAHDTALAGLSPRTLKVYGGHIVDIANLARRGAETGDSQDGVKFTFVKPTGPTTAAFATWGSHLGIGANPPMGYGTGKGASSIRSDTITMVVDDISRTTDPVDSTLENAVRQGTSRRVSAGTVVIQRVTIVKDAVPDDPQDFIFSGSPGIGSFTLDDDPADSALPNSKSFSLSPGTYSVTETVPPEWTMTGATCTDGSPIVVISLSAAEAVTCTFVNTKKAGLTIAKNAIPDDPLDFEFAPSFGDNFLLDDDPASATPSSMMFLVSPGTYNVAEVNVPSNWDFTSAVCSDDSPVSAIVLSPGEAVTCTFMNTKRGQIIVDEVTRPSGDFQSFDFTLSGGPDAIRQTFSLTDSATPHDSGFLKPGTFTVTETGPSGWDLAGATCDDGSPPSSIILDPGEVIICTFTNAKRGTIIVEKRTNPAAVGSFTFTGDASGTISNGGQIVVGDFLPGTYVSAESDPTPGFDLTSIACDDGSSSTPSTFDLSTRTATFHLDVGETVMCTFTNTMRGTIIVDIVTNPSGDPQSFDFLLTGPDAIRQTFSLTDTAPPRGSGPVKPGTYAASETALTGWDLTSATCSDGSPPSSIILDPGETVTCTFTNTKRGTIIVEKQTNPDGAPGSFPFTGDAAGSIPDGGQIGVSNLPPGTYTSTESDPTPAFDLTSIACDDSNSSGEVSTRTATFHLDPGESVKCTFTNSKPGGHIVIDKVTLPGGDSRTFDFTLSGGPDGITQSFSLTDAAAPHDSGLIKPGTYRASETVPAGWDRTGATCSDGSSPGSIILDPGETVTCTFTNTKRGQIKVDTVTAPIGDSTPFAFTLTGVSPFTLADATPPFDTGFTLVPGSYTVAESVPAGWDLTGLVCTESVPSAQTLPALPVAGSATAAAPATVALSPGETVTCIFTDSKRGTIIVDKVTSGGRCAFDRDTQTAGQQFRLLFTKHPDAPGGYKLSASNPGQFSDNVFFDAAPGSSAKVSIEIPYPFVTQGAKPIHVTDGVTFKDGCFVPGTDITRNFIISKTSIALSDYASQAFGEVVTVTASTSDAPDSGVIYVHIHLDYGLKATGGWSPGSGNAATHDPNLPPNIPDLQSYSFSSVVGTSTDSLSVQSENVFKRNPSSENPGFGGVVANTEGDGIQGVTVEVHRPDGTLLGSTTTDAEGLYFLAYNHAGKPARFTVKLPTYNVEQTVTVKSGGFVRVDFLDVA